MPIADVRTLDDLRIYVHETLCQRENLLKEQFPLSETRLRRASRDCGLEFSVHGPRSVSLSAVWASDHNVLYFYDARGERFGKSKLTHRIERPADAA